MVHIKHTSYIDMPCQRCGSKRYTAKTWKEKISTYFGGFTEVEYSLIKCKNKECQEAFEKKELDEAAKRAVIRDKKEENEVARKAKIHLQLKKTRSNVSRI